MKRIQYVTIGYLNEYNPETDSLLRKEVPIAMDKPYNETNEEIARLEALGGEYVVAEVDQDIPATAEERIAELEEALELLLSGVTE